MVIILQYEYKANHCAALLKLMQSFMSIQGQKLGGPHAWRAAAKRSYPTSEVRGSGRECQAVTVQEQPRGATPRPGSGAATRGVTLPPRSGQPLGGVTPRPRSGGCAGAGGPRGAIPRWRSGRAPVRRYSSSKVRSSGYALLEELWRDTPGPR